MWMLRQWCSLNMLNRTCEYMHGGVRLVGWNMPNGWCSLSMPVYFKPLGIKKYFQIIGMEDHGIERTIKESSTYGLTTPHLIEI